MLTQRFLRQNLPIVIFMITLLMLAVAGSVVISRKYQSIRAEKRVEVRERFLAQAFAEKKQALEFGFKAMYESLRTITLLPAVRDIRGGNRTSDAEDVIANGRFSEDANLTVQQLYNNLASDIAVSEVYAIVDGFDPKKGEIPFFMYDTPTLR